MKLCSFEERLAAQRKEREMAKEELGFKKPLSKEEANEKKKQRLAAIGNSRCWVLLINFVFSVIKSIDSLTNNQLLESRLLLEPILSLFRC